MVYRVGASHSDLANPMKPSMMTAITAPGHPATRIWRKNT